MLSMQCLFLIRYLLHKAPERMENSGYGRAREEKSTVCEKVHCSACCTSWPKGSCRSDRVIASFSGNRLLSNWVFYSTPPIGSLLTTHLRARSNCEVFTAQPVLLRNIKTALRSRQAWKLPMDFLSWIFCSLAQIWLQLISQKMGSLLGLSDDSGSLLDSAPSSPGPKCCSHCLHRQIVLDFCYIFSIFCPYYNVFWCMYSLISGLVLVWPVCVQKLQLVAYWGHICAVWLNHSCLIHILWQPSSSSSYINELKY